jgi:hydroxymethylpyrimidine/phosphomethylpyrimidine kinase
LAEQLDAVLEDLKVEVVKTGMLPTAEVVRLVADKVRATASSQEDTEVAAPSWAVTSPNPESLILVGVHQVMEHRVRLVVDPVLLSTSGHALTDGSVSQAILLHLAPRATLITPNIPEASALLGTSATIEMWRQLCLKMSLDWWQGATA